MSACFERQLCTVCVWALTDHWRRFFPAVSVHAARTHGGCRRAYFGCRCGGRSGGNGRTLARCAGAGRPYISGADGARGGGGGASLSISVQSVTLGVSVAGAVRGQVGEVVHQQQQQQQHQRHQQVNTALQRRVCSERCPPAAGLQRAVPGAVSGAAAGQSRTDPRPPYRPRHGLRPSTCWRANKNGVQCLFG